MKIRKFILFVVFIILGSQVFAFFSQGSDVGGVGGASCVQPKFKKMYPENLSVVTPQSEISFVVSKSANPKTIVVTAKKKPIELVVKESSDGYIVSGKLPDSLSGTYARVEVKGSTVAGCPGNVGWMLKIDSIAATGGSSEATEAE
ncbi:MAG: hypothetical protein JKY01_12490 [Pseudomonadales bacterium]|nr:hypothetical protein [Pseudomonadales bacterium]